MKTDPVKKARRDALREAQNFMFARAQMMIDPWARSVMNAAAFEFGVAYLKGLDATDYEVAEANPHVERVRFTKEQS